MQRVERSVFGELNGKPIHLFRLSNANGMVAELLEFGGRIKALCIPDGQGGLDNMSVGYDTFEPYHARFNPWLGALLGRTASRVTGARFQIDGKTYNLSASGPAGSNMHGGFVGFDSRVWTVDSHSADSIVMHYVSPDGEEGYPGELTVQVTYAVTDDNALRIGYRARTDRPTVVNLSNHTLFNLGGEGSGTILGHELWIDAEATTPVDSVLIPTGRIAPVGGTPFDFRTPALIGARIDADDEQLRNGHGYDHNWVLGNFTGAVRLVASLYDPASGRKMEILTDQPGIQFYSGNFFNDGSCGKFGRKIGYRGAVALETQHFPDAPNHPQFPSTLLRPGETYTQTCIYRFCVCP